MKSHLEERPDHFQREILDLLKSRRLCDGEIFLIDEQKIFYVHKVIMAAGSPYFKAVFTCGMKESMSGRVELSGISADVMDTIIKYAYTNHVKITEENVESLFIVAHRFLIFSICKLCADYIISKLTVPNCVGFYQFSKFYTYESLAKKCWHYLLENFTVVSEQSDEFLLLSAHELGYILDDDNLNIKNEESVFYACERWIRYEPIVRMGFATKLLSNLRVKQSRLELLVKNVNEKQVNQPCKVRASLVTLLDGIRLIRGFISERPRIPSEVIFITGGYGSDGTLPHIETYDVRVDQWFLLQNNMHYRRAYHGTVVLRKQIFILGGYSDNQYYNGVHRFDISSGQWRELSPMHFSRCYVACATLNGRIFACGGHDGIRRHSSVESYCRSTNQWNLVSPMRQKRSDAAIVSLKGNNEQFT